MHVFRTIVDGKKRSVKLLIAELIPGQSIQELFETLYKNLETAERTVAEAFIIRPPVKDPIDPKFVDAAIKERRARYPRACGFLKAALEDRTRAFARTGGKPVHLLYSYDHVIHISPNINQEGVASPLDDGTTTHAEAISAIKDGEIDYIVDRSQAKLVASEGILYRAPSGILMRSFLRVGNLQQSRSAIDGVFFWLIPNLRGCVGLITDTWSISSLSMNASRRLSVYRGNKTPCPVEMLGQYHDGSEAVAAEAAELIEHLLNRALINEEISDDPPERQRVVFLISATHTGSLVQKLRQLLEERGVAPDKVVFVAVFKLGKSETPIEVVRDLSIGAASMEFEPVSPKGSVTEIEIDRHVYFPLHYRNVEFDVDAHIAKPVKAFLTSYKNADLLRVHKTIDDDGPISHRHHMIWVNTETLIGHPAFRRRFYKALDELDPVPSVIVTPTHSAARKLGEMAVARIKRKRKDVKLYRHSTLLIPSEMGESDGEVFAALEQIGVDGAVLILDDAYITGMRLTQYQKHLRSFSGRIHYLVALARPESMSIWNRAQRDLRYREQHQPGVAIPQHTITAVETVILPNWNEGACPWCLELQRYRVREAELGTALPDATLKKRADVLSSGKSDGLCDDLFLEIGDMGLSLRKNSIFANAPASQAAVFSAVASSLQVLRTAPLLEGQVALGPRNFPICTVIKKELYLGNTFSELCSACGIPACGEGGGAGLCHPCRRECSKRLGPDINKYGCCYLLRRGCRIRLWVTYSKITRSWFVDCSNRRTRLEGDLCISIFRIGSKGLRHPDVASVISFLAMKGNPCEPSWFEFHSPDD